MFDKTPKTGRRSLRKSKEEDGKSGVPKKLRTEKEENFSYNFSLACSS
jgi:hypothetical protein